jgi:hypothetical protein
MKNHKIFIIILSVFTFLQFNIFATQSLNQVVRDILSTIPEKDQEKLSSFFEQLVNGDSFGFTLFGAKSASFSCYSEKPDFVDLALLSRERFFLREGKNTWLKYCSSFPVKDFIIKIWTDKDTLRTSIYLIKKSLFIKTAEENIDIFRKVLGHKITPQQILDEISREETSVEQVLGYNEALKGIILGYGRANSSLFQKREELGRAIFSYFTPPATSENLNSLSERNVSFLKFFQHLDKQSPVMNISSDNPTNLIKEYKHVDSLLMSFCSDREPLEFIHFLNFAADPDEPETKFYFDKYSKAYAEMVKAYRQGDFLEVTLCKMIE